MTQIAGLIGLPVEHSVSPRFQQAAFDALGIDARYERWSTSADELSERVATLRGPRYLGANVTVPHKEAVLRLLDDVDSVARRVGAVNTIYPHDGRLVGFNTDVTGFRRALRDAGGFDAAGTRATVLGAGGAARAVALALALEGAAHIAVANRHADRAQRLVAELRANSSADLVALEWDEAVSVTGLRRTNLLVHCTTLGLAGSAGSDRSPVAPADLHGDLFVCDIVANPQVTPLLRAAEDAGCRSVGGLPMLVYQGAASFELWTGKPAPVTVMLEAARAAMAETEA